MPSGRAQPSPPQQGDAELYAVSIHIPPEHFRSEDSERDIKTEQNATGRAQSKKQQQIQTTQLVGGQIASADSKLHYATTETQSEMPTEQFLSSVANPHPVNVNDSPTTPKNKKALQQQKKELQELNGNLKDAFNALKKNPRFQCPAGKKFIESVKYVRDRAGVFYRKDFQKHHLFVSNMLKLIQNDNFGITFELKPQLEEVMKNRLRQGRALSKEPSQTRTELETTIGHLGEQLASARERRDNALRDMTQHLTPEKLSSAKKKLNRKLSSSWNRRNEIAKELGVEDSIHPSSGKTSGALNTAPEFDAIYKDPRDMSLRKRNKSKYQKQCNLHAVQQRIISLNEEINAIQNMEAEISAPGSQYRVAESHLKSAEREVQSIEDKLDQAKSELEVQEFLSNVVADIDEIRIETKHVKRNNKQSQPDVEKANILCEELYKLIDDKTGDWNKESVDYESVSKLSETSQQKLRSIRDQAEDLYLTSKKEVEKKKADLTIFSLIDPGEDDKEFLRKSKKLFEVAFTKETFPLSKDENLLSDLTSR
ncbi:MAG: hypothetical protein HUJ26_09080 [Planctomycetaceae bacterium]|nr:hypothetical protein [Planctomycetaceae bacterium]